MNKPTKFQPQPTYIYGDVIEYIEGKYAIRTRDMTGKFRGNSKAPYLDFWRWFIDRYEPHNGSYVWVHVDEELENPWAAPWVKHPLRLIKDEFGSDFDNGSLLLWVEW